ncbi:hypothetical protein C7447_101683 [Tenacibaculum adriaticum]|uniref:Uncharacterized protein n=1 Tax=Tenacibaculum adriaticum TaxID=413713 RepID=A0A5S5DWG6_9FLAO|nr:hypothetical protein [Tenacibaculum adriaticum]TYQ00075.1 hypothetical protein C7447_101683 [Tenacibaculum adriaticum]
MSKLFAISYSLLILVQSFNINLEDVSKFKVLLEHAEFHQKTYGDSFFEFIAEHYGSEKYTHGSDHKEHENLPFKGDHQMCSHIHIPFTINSTNYNIEHPSFVEIPFNFFYKESHSIFEKHAVFQPPKCA